MRKNTMGRDKPCSYKLNLTALGPTPDSGIYYWIIQMLKKSDYRDFLNVSNAFST